MGLFWVMSGKSKEVHDTFKKSLTLGAETALAHAVTAGRRNKLTDYDFLFPSLKDALVEQKAFNLNLTDKGIFKGLNKKDITDATCLPLIQALADFIKKYPEVLKGYQINITVAHVLDKQKFSEVLTSFFKQLPQGYKVHLVTAEDNSQLLTESAYYAIAEASKNGKVKIENLPYDSRYRQYANDNDANPDDQSEFLDHQECGLEYVNCLLQAPKQANYLTSTST